MGYHQAGFTEILGIDIADQPNYPFDFIQSDVFHSWVKSSILSGKWDLVHASPPCQSYTPMSNRWGSGHPELIPATRSLISSRPYVIENVQGAGRDLIDPIRLTGEMFGLPTHRPRLFEVRGFKCEALPKAPRQRNPVAVYGKPDGRRLWTRKDGSELRAWDSVEQGKAALEVLWMQTADEVRESIPPRYTQYIGERFLEYQQVIASMTGKGQERAKA